MTTWLSDASANRHIKTYVKDFLDVSGNFSVRSKAAPLTLTTGGYDWQTRGQVISGIYETNSVHLGWCVDMDASGNRIVAGGPYYAEGSYAGYAVVYQYDASAQVWYQLGNIMRNASHNYDNLFGRSVHMTADGNRVAIVDTHFDNNQGYYELYDYNSSNNTWGLADYAWGHKDHSYWGNKGSALSGVGNIFAAGNQHTSDYKILYRYYNGASWSGLIQVGPTYSQAPALNYDGTRISMLNNAVLRVYERPSSTSQSWSEIFSVSVPDLAAHEAQNTALNHDGTVVACSNDYNERIYVYKYDSSTNSWGQYGQPLAVPHTQGFSNDKPGASEVRSKNLRLNKAGDQIIFGAHNRWEAYVFRYDTTRSDWVQVGSTLAAPAEEWDNDHHYGYSCAFSDDASKLIVSARSADFNQVNSGGLYMYEWADASGTSVTASDPVSVIDVSNGVLTLNSINTNDTYSFRGERIRPSDTTYTQSYGQSVAINGDGNIIAIGAAVGNNLSGTTEPGYVEVKQYNNGSWSALGSTIYGPSSDYFKLGACVDLNNSGTRLVVGAQNNNVTRKGAMLVYDWSGSSWVQVGSQINGTSNDNRFTQRGGLAINYAGDIIVGMSIPGGYARAYQYVDASGDWYQLGSDISTTASSTSYEGKRVALNDDGTILAVGDANYSSNHGVVRVYKFTGDVNDGSWNQLGGDATIRNTNQTNYWGTNVSLSADGYTLFVSSPYAGTDTNNGAGVGRVYRYSETSGQWVIVGPNINSHTLVLTNENINMGASSDISKDGTIAVFSDHNNDTGGSDRGAMVMLKYTQGYWKQIATAYFTDYGATDNSDPGWYTNIQMNRDSTRIIVGAYQDDDGATNVGSVYVLDLVHDYGKPTTIHQVSVGSGFGFDVSYGTVTHYNSTTDNALFLKDSNEQAAISLCVPSSSTIDWNTEVRNAGGMNWYCNGQMGTRRAKIGHQGPLVVYGGSFYANWGGIYKMQYNSDDVGEPSNRNWAMTVGFMANGDIIANDDGSSGAFAVVSWYSDKRIKKDIQSINDASALEKLRLLNPCTYDYINKVKMGDRTVQGFIAQEVKEVLPYAVKTELRQIPNIYTMGTYSLDDMGDKIITIPDYDTANLSLDASGNVYPYLEVFDENDKRVGPIVITKVVSSTTLQVSCSVTIPDEIFVYGQYVNDFHFIDKDKIFTVATAAMQEVDRQLQADKAKTATMESQVADLLARVTALENK